MKVIPNAKYQAGYNNERKITIIINNSGKLEEKRRKGRKRRKNWALWALVWSKSWNVGWALKKYYSALLIKDNKKMRGWCFFLISQVCGGGWHLLRKLLLLWRGMMEAESHRNWGRIALHWPLTLQHCYSGLSTDPGGGWILVEVITPWVIAGSALVRPRIV